VQDVEIPSQRYGRYTLRSRLGVGGMAEVFLAQTVDEHGQELSVALKLMKTGVPEQAFADEADLMGLLDHSNLIPRLEVGEAFGRPYIAMEYLIGGDLRGLLASQRRLPPALAFQVILEVLRALAYFHNAKTRSGVAMGLVHGDVNPANIFFAGSGDVKLGDYGVAKSRTSNIGPRDGLTAGKLNYLSPEQTRGEALTPASDLFSLGVVMHEVLYGQPPFQGDDVKAVVSAIRSAKLHLPDKTDKALIQIFKRALSPDLGHRYKTAGEFAGALTHYVLDRDLAMNSHQVKGWMEETLGLAL